MWQTRKIQIGQQIPARREELVLICNKNVSIDLQKKGSIDLQFWKICRFCSFGGPQSKILRKGKDKLILEPCFRTKTNLEHESDDDANCSWLVWNCH